MTTLNKYWLKLLNQDNAVVYLGTQFSSSKFPFIIAVSSVSPNKFNENICVEIVNWFKNNIKSPFSPISWSIFAFADEEEALLFKLAWT